MTVLETFDLSIGYPRQKVVAEHLNLALQRGELVCLLGPNGAGKSTLMRTLAAMQPPLGGSVQLMGQDVFTLKAEERAKHLSIVLTQRLDSGLLTGYGLIALGRHPYTDWTGRLTQHDEAVIQWAVEAVGAQELAPRQVAELSDGERQKILIARALAQEPDLMLLDEPTAFLDLPRRVEIMRLLRQLASETKRAVLLSTHDLDLALRTAHRLWLMSSSGEIKVGAPEDLVLSGAFQATFRSEGVDFDIHTGAFKIHHSSKGTVRLIGDGITAEWTRRALEREGYTLSDDAALTIEIIDQQCWQLTDQQQQQVFTSIYDLMNALN